jgi:hypothetical protein
VTGIWSELPRAEKRPSIAKVTTAKAGTTSPVVVVNAALASLATEDELGPWLARNWGALADTPPEQLAQIDL